MLVGEAPGRDEDLLAEPFVGKAGQVLRENLKLVGVDPALCWITNVLKYRPNVTNRDPYVSEIQESIPYLTREVALVNPYLIVLLGRVATATFYPGEKFQNVRGNLYERQGRHVLSTYHPAAVLYSKAKLPEFQSHLRIVAEFTWHLREIGAVANDYGGYTE